MKPLLSLRSMSRRGTVNLWLFIITAITGPLVYLMSPKLWSFAMVSWALVCVTPIVVAIVLIPVIKGCAQGSVRDAVRFQKCYALGWLPLTAVLWEWALSCRLR